MSHPALPAWYRANRERDDALFRRCAPVGEETISHSPSGRWSVAVQSYGDEHRARFGVGVVRAAGIDDSITIVRRNLPGVPVLFCEDHASGHDYLVTEEDYQGMTVVELDTGRRVDFTPEAAKEGYGLCSVQTKVAREGTRLLVVGCIWSAASELLVLDFTEPLEHPLSIVDRAPIGTDLESGTNGRFAFNAGTRFRPEDWDAMDELDGAGRHGRALYALPLRADVPCVYDPVADRIVRVDGE